MRRGVRRARTGEGRVPEGGTASRQPIKGSCRQLFRNATRRLRQAGPWVGMYDVDAGGG